MGPKKGKGKTWFPNHFVPINPEPNGNDDDDATDDEKQTEGSACGGCDDDDVLIDDDDAYDVDAEVDDDYAEYDNNEIDSDTRDEDDDDDEEEETSKVGEDTETHDKTRVSSAGKALPSNNFLPVDIVIDLLTGDTSQKVHASVPLGTKENQWFLVENSDNIKRRKVEQKSQYWDDCGAWGNKTKASTPSTVYIRQNGHAMHVVKKEVIYCQEKQSDGRKIYKAVKPQPASKDVFTHRRNYCRHAHSNSLVPETTVSHNSCKSFNFSISLLKKLQKEVLLDWNLNLTLS